MALEIKPSPVLTGKAARDFYKSLKNQPPIKETKEELLEGLRKFREFMKEQKHWHQQ